MASRDREFGVPFPGTIVPDDRRTQTALKSIPEGPIDWASLFGRSAPIVLDLGCGNGRSTMHAAVLKPTHDHLGVDTLPVVIRYARKRGNERGFKNVKFAVLGGLELLSRHIAPQTISEIHIYHPQPYYDPALVHRRLITPTFMALVHQALVPGGLLVMQTDHPNYWKYMRELAGHYFDFHERIGRWPDATKGRTRREIVAMKKGLTIYRGSGTAKREITPDEAFRLADSLPPPVFEADRRLIELDRLA